MSFLYSTKRFSATSAQLAIIRQQISTYVHNHFRNLFHRDIQRRQELGARLIAVSGPEVRIDSFIAQTMLLVDRRLEDNYAPPLPDSNHHGWR